MTDYPEIYTENGEEIISDMDDLFIPANIGGRVQFIKKWPEAAEILLGPWLYKHDTEGVGERSRIPSEEELVENKRLLITKVVSEFHGTIKTRDGADMSKFNILSDFNDDALLGVIFQPEFIEKIHEQFDLKAEQDRQKQLAEERQRQLDAQSRYEDDRDGDDDDDQETIDISRMIKESTEVGKEIFSELKDYAKEYTPKIKKKVIDIKENIKEETEKHRKEKASEEWDKNADEMTSVPIDHESSQAKENDEKLDRKHIEKAEHSIPIDPVTIDDVLKDEASVLSNLPKNGLKAEKKSAKKSGKPVPPEIIPHQKNRNSIPASFKSLSLQKYGMPSSVSWDELLENLPAVQPFHEQNIGQDNPDEPFLYNYNSDLLRNLGATTGSDEPALIKKPVRKININAISHHAWGGQIGFSDTSQNVLHHLKTSIHNQIYNGLWPVIMIAKLNRGNNQNKTDEVQ